MKRYKYCELHRVSSIFTRGSGMSRVSLTFETSKSFILGPQEKKAMSTATVPPEISDRTIDFLHSDKPTLAACSLVSKSWLPASRYHLFERLELGPSRNVQRFQDPQNRSIISRIAPYVRRIDISEDDRLKWMNTVLPHIQLADFTEVKSLLLSNMNYHSDPSAGATLQALGTSFPRVTRLRVDTVFFNSTPRILEFICLFPLLEEVRLDNVRVRDYGPTFESSADPNPLPRLRSLRVENRHTLLALWNWCRFYGNRPSVDNLTLTADGGEVSSIAKLLKNLGSSLKALTIGFGHRIESDYPDPGIDLFFNTELSTVHLLFPPTDEDVSLTTPVVLVLSRIACPSLRNVVISLQFTLEQLRSSQPDSWLELDEVFTKPDFRGLGAIALRLFDVDGCIMRKEDADEAVTKIRTWLPNCEKRGLLQRHKPMCLVYNTDHC